MKVKHDVYHLTNTLLQFFVLEAFKVGMDINFHRI